MNRLRLEREIREMKRLPALRDFSLFEDTNCSRNEWDRYFWRGKAPSGHVVVAPYKRGHPYQSMDVNVTPKLDTHHYLAEDRICYLRAEEWSANFTAATAILITFRFIDR